MTLSHTLTLSQKQAETLLDYGIDVSVPGTLYHIEGKSLHPSLADAIAYVAGQYIIFLSGDSMQHSSFWKAIFKSHQEPQLKFYHSGITAYSTPLERYLSVENQVTVDVSPDSGSTKFLYQL